MHMEFVEPSKRFADVIIPLGMNQVALDMFLSRLHQEIGDQLPPLPTMAETKIPSQIVSLGKQGSLSL